MSFWAGVVQGVKDVDVLKEKEALADERQGVRDEATARYDESITYRNRMQQLADDRNAVIDAQRGEAHTLAMATGNLAIAQKLGGLAGGIGGGTRTGTGGVTVPTPQAMEKGRRDLQARIDEIGGFDDMSATQQAYYKPILDNAAASYELNNMLEKAVGDDTDLTVLTAVDRVRMTAVVSAQGQEAFNAFRRTAAEDGWDPAEVAEAMRLAESVNPAFAELVLMTPSKDNLTEQEQYKSLEQQLMVHAGIWLQSNERTEEVITALNQFSSGNAEVKSRGMATLIGLGVGQDWIYGNTPESSLLRSLSGPQVSAVPTVNADGTLVPVGGGTTPADIPSFASTADILKLPKDEQAALVGKRVNIDGVIGVMEVVPAGGSVGAPKSLSEPYKEYGESRQAVVGSELQAKYGQEFGQAGAQKVAETAWTVLQKTGEYMLKGADRGAGVALGSVNEVGSWLGVGLGFMNEAMGLDGTAMFQGAGELDDVAGKLLRGGISSSDAAQKLAGMWRESLTREGGDVSAQMSESFGDYNVTIPTREEINTGSTPEGASIKEAINALVSEVQQTTRSEGYRPTQMGPTELNSPKVLEALTPETRKIVEAELQQTTRSEGYRPTQMGPTELNLPKILEALTPETRKAVEAELQEMPSARAVGTVGFQDLGAREGVPSSESPSAGQGTTTLAQQSSMLSEDLNDAGRSTGEGENLSTDRSAGPRMALQDLNPDDLVELEAGVEELISAIMEGVDQGKIEDITRGLNAKFTQEIVGVALRMAMGS